MDFRKLLEENEFVYLDGGMGTTFLDLGIETGEIPELLNLTSPEVLEKIHGMFIDAGSMILYSNTFGANRYKLEDTGYTVDEVIGAGVANLKNAIRKSGKEAYAALDVGPLGRLMEPG